MHRCRLNAEHRRCCHPIKAVPSRNHILVGAILYDLQDRLLYPIVHRYLS